MTTVDSTRLRGIVPPLITPLSDQDALDLPGLERLISHLITGGIHGLFILGTTGEGPSLSYRLRLELIRHACHLVDHRVPVLVGITDTSFAESLGLARAAADAGAAALVAAPPFYFPAGQPELAAYFSHLARQVPLPLYLYNMPAMTKTVHIANDTLERLLNEPNIIGLKDSSGDLAYFEQALSLARRRPDWSVLIGPEAMLQTSLQMGGDGGVPGGANLCPRLFVDLFNAYLAGDRVRGAELQVQVEALDQLYRIGRHTSAIIKGLKCALSLAGICGDNMAEPFNHFEVPERARVQALLHGPLHALPLPIKV